MWIGASAVMVVGRGGASQVYYTQSIVLESVKWGLITQNMLFCFYHIQVRKCIANLLSYKQGNDAVDVITSFIACVGHFTGHGIFLIFSTPQSQCLLLRFNSKAEILYNFSMLNKPTIDVQDKRCESQNMTLLLKTSIFSYLGHFIGHRKIAIVHATRWRNGNQHHTFILLYMYKFSMIKF